jgi:hypothetical protein
VADDSADAPRPLRFEEVTRILELAASEPPDVVLIGGQALNYWADRYSSESQYLRETAPFTSGDVDFLRGLPTAQRIARLLPGRLHTKDVYDIGVTIATVTYRDESGDDRLIHFLGEMHGMDVNDVVRTSLRLDGYLRILHPVLCLESRLSNVLDLTAYRTEHARKQAAAAIEVARAYVNETLSSGDIRGALDANERIFAYAKRRAAACAREGFDPFAAVMADDRLPEAFRNIRYPQMVSQMEQAVRQGPPSIG